MDNGLIFPYPCACARDESSVLTTQKVADRFLRERAAAGCVGPSVVVVKRRGDAERQPYQSVVTLGQARREKPRQIRVSLILRGDA
jgi:hypothetical protein